MATTIAALKARARREIQHQFFAADAVRPDRTIEFRPSNSFEERQFDELRKTGVLHEQQPGHYWLDLPAYDRLVAERFGRVRLAALLFLAIAIVAALAAGTRIGG